MSEAIKRNRRGFLGAEAMTISAARLGRFGSADAQSAQEAPRAFTQAIVDVDAF